jgi:hypothetical protein
MRLGRWFVILVLVGFFEAWPFFTITGYSYIEGLLTIVIGVIAKWWISDWPEQAKFLTEDERAMLINNWPKTPEMLQWIILIGDQ